MSWDNGGSFPTCLRGLAKLGESLNGVKDRTEPQVGSKRFCRALKSSLESHKDKVHGPCSPTISEAFYPVRGLTRDWTVHITSNLGFFYQRPFTP